MFDRIKGGDIVNFTRQLSTMITAGLTLTESLGFYKNRTNRATKKSQSYYTMLRRLDLCRSLAKTSKGVFARLHRTYSLW